MPPPHARLGSPDVSEGTRMDDTNLLIRHGKKLNIRMHKKDWLDAAYLRKIQQNNRSFAEHLLTHPRRVEVRACYVCGATAKSPFATTHGVPYVACAACTHVYARYAIPPEDLAKYYRTDYFPASVYLDKEQVQTRTRALLEPKLAFVAQFVQGEEPRRWLDVGTGNGSVVVCAREMGFDAHGIEFGHDAIDFARTVHEIEIGERTVREELALRGPSSYDIVSFFMVLEHVVDPADQVAAARELLTAKGLLVVEVPKADSVAAMGDATFPDSALRQLAGDHLMNYTLRSVRTLVESHGFCVEGLWFLGQDVFNTLAHMALATPSFLDSPLCNFLLDNNDDLQLIIDRKQLSDEVILVARRVEPAD
jgi:2-polyprenyl-3-methyl-5-hydroxy-6-metoxy-1,4-benzoquinol methylase